MNPILGSYLLVNHLAIRILLEAGSYDKEVLVILKDAIDDAEYKINKSRKAS